MWRRIKSAIDRKLLLPLRESHAPIHELALGTGVGIFWAVTPLVGARMTMVTVTWLGLRQIGLRFTLPVALAWVWVPNPVLMPIISYTFYLTGILVYNLIGIEIAAISLSAIELVLREARDLPLLEGLSLWGRFLMDALGWPMLVGSLVLGIPLVLFSYPLTVRMVNEYRKRKAASMGLTLAQWEERFVYARPRSHNQPPTAA